MISEYIFGEEICKRIWKKKILEFAAMNSSTAALNIELLVSAKKEKKKKKNE